MTQILDRLSTTLSEFVNRRFVTNGVLPALVVYVGLGVHSISWSEARFRVVQALRDPAVALADMGWELCVVLILATGFVAIRRPVLEGFSRVPVPLLRDLTLNLSMRWRQHLEWKRDLWQARYTGIRWHPEGRFATLTGKAPDPPPDTPSAIRRRSRRARSLLESPLWLLRGRFILDSLSQLRLISFGEDRPSDDLLDWRRLSSGRRGERLDRLLVIARSHFRELQRRIEAYPDDPERMMPTRLGNRLGALDDYARRRYGIDTSVLMVRLRGLLDAHDRTEINRVREAATAYLNLCVAFVLVLVWVGLVEATEAVSFGAGGEPDPRAIGLIVAAAVASYTAYVAAVSTVDRLHDVLSQHVDLNRLRVLRALGYAAPTNLEEEKEALGALQSFYAQGWSLSPAPGKVAPVTLDPSAQAPD